MGAVNRAARQATTRPKRPCHLVGPREAENVQGQNQGTEAEAMFRTAQQGCDSTEMSLSMNNRSWGLIVPLSDTQELQMGLGEAAALALGAVRTGKEL